MRKAPSIMLENGVKLFDLERSKVAFSFFNMIFLDPQLPDKDTIIRHELVHIKQRHSIDVVIFEMVQIVNWVSPITYLIKKDIKLIHEFLADEGATSKGVEKYNYALFLIKNASAIQDVALSNQIFGSSNLKSRISMLNQKKSAKWARLKLLFVLPISIGTLCISTMAFTKDYGFIDIYSGTSQIKVIIRQDTVKKPFYSNGINVPNLKTVNFDYSYNDRLKKPMPITKRLFVFNGEVIEAGTSGGAKNVDQIILLDAENGIKRYGQKGKYGVIEVRGSKAVMLSIPPPPPPTMAPPPPPKVAPPTVAPPPPPKNEPTPTNKSGADAAPTATTNQQLSFFIDRSKNQKLVLPENDNRNSILIANKWGNEVYKSEKYLNDWDGKGENLSTGSYFFIQKEINNQGEVVNINRGYVNVVDSMGDFLKSGSNIKGEKVSTVELSKDQGNKLVFAKTSDRRMLTIFNTQGKGIYRTDDYQNNWNANVGNLQNGLYYFSVATINTAGRKTGSSTGSIALVN
ncbi:gliding motility-associated C-terminal domain-containing protein [Pedobacter endophyticus]|uniref:Gliding motility-associated C-terminal domain-containing protein n=2 Tax=Pedobacter endophyticus TaxID=2789740 RepID=A0A7S9PZ91_9SPHI|nr:gliding motility-associated C-terminal domain-containing protein [Pedobacter endophyticus]